MKPQIAICMMLVLVPLDYTLADDQPSGAALSLAQTIPIPQITGGTNHLAADARRQRFFVTAPGEKKVAVVDLKAAKVLQVMSDVPASAACFLPDLDQLCLSGNGGIVFYDGAGLKMLGKVELGGAVDELQYDQKEKRLYVGLMDAQKPEIAVIDASARKLLASIKLPAKPQGFVLELDGSRIFVNTPGAGQVTVLDRRKQSLEASWKLSGAQSNYPIALDGKNHRLFVGCRRPASLLVLDADTGKTIASVETGGDADDMSFDPAAKLILLACGTGVISSIQQLDADHYRKLPDVSTPEGARNSLFAPELETFYLAVPHHGDTPAQLRAYRARD